MCIYIYKYILYIYIYRSCGGYIPTSCGILWIQSSSFVAHAEISSMRSSVGSSSCRVRPGIPTKWGLHWGTPIAGWLKKEWMIQGYPDRLETSMLKWIILMGQDLAPAPTKRWSWPNKKYAVHPMKLENIPQFHGLGQRKSPPVRHSDSPSAPYWGGRLVPPVLWHLDSSAIATSWSFVVRTEDRPKFDPSSTLFCWSNHLSWRESRVFKPWPKKSSQNGQGTMHHFKHSTPI